MILAGALSCRLPTNGSIDPRDRVLGWPLVTDYHVSASITNPNHWLRHRTVLILGLCIILDKAQLCQQCVFAPKNQLIGNLMSW